MRLTVSGPKSIPDSLPGVRETDYRASDSGQIKRVPETSEESTRHDPKLSLTGIALDSAMESNKNNDPVSYGS
jgi:hypothetical protein